MSFGVPLYVDTRADHLEELPYLILCEKGNDTLLRTSDVLGSGSLDSGR